MAGLVSPAIAGSLPNGIKVNATLVWGAEAAPTDKKLNKVKAPVQKKLQATLRKMPQAKKWNHFYRINHKEFEVAGKAHKVRMSDHCEVEIRRLKGDLMHVKLFGEGKLVVDKKASLKRDKSLVVGGHCADKSAWFVVLQFD